MAQKVQQAPQAKLIAQRTFSTTTFASWTPWTILRCTTVPALFIVSLSSVLVRMTLACNFAFASSAASEVGVTSTALVILVVSAEAETFSPAAGTAASLTGAVSSLGGTASPVVGMVSPTEGEVSSTAGAASLGALEDIILTA